jgi:hypothetical protein
MISIIFIPNHISQNNSPKNHLSNINCMDENGNTKIPIFKYVNKKCFTDKKYFYL